FFFPLLSTISFQSPTLLWPSGILPPGSSYCTVLPSVWLCGVSLLAVYVSVLPPAAFSCVPPAVASSNPPLRCSGVLRYPPSHPQAVLPGIPLYSESHRLPGSSGIPRDNPPDDTCGA